MRFPILLSLLVASALARADHGNTPIARRAPLAVAPAPRRIEIEKLVRDLDGDFPVREAAERKLESLVPKFLPELRALRRSPKLDAEGSSRLDRVLGPYDPVVVRNWDSLARAVASALSTAPELAESVAAMNAVLTALGPEHSAQLERNAAEMEDLRRMNLAALRAGKPIDAANIERIERRTKESREIARAAFEAAKMDPAADGARGYLVTIGKKSYLVRGFDRMQLEMTPEEARVDVAARLRDAVDKRAESLLAPNGDKIAVGKQPPASMELFLLATPRGKTIEAFVSRGENVADNVGDAVAEWMKAAFPGAAKDIPARYPAPVLRFPATHRNAPPGPQN